MLEAYCDSGKSQACGLRERPAVKKTGQKYIIRSINAVKKKVEGKPDRCPDCGSSLVWKRG